MWWPSFLDCSPCGGFWKMAKPIFYSAQFFVWRIDGSVTSVLQLLLPLMRWRLCRPRCQWTALMHMARSDSQAHDVCLTQMLMIITSIHMCMCKLWLSYVINSHVICLFDRATWFIKIWMIWVKKVYELMWKNDNDIQQNGTTIWNYFIWNYTSNIWLQHWCTRSIVPAMSLARSTGEYDGIMRKCEDWLIDWLTEPYGERYKRRIFEFTYRTYTREQFGFDRLIDRERMMLSIM